MVEVFIGVLRILQVPEVFVLTVERLSTKFQLVMVLQTMLLPVVVVVELLSLKERLPIL